jgi:hypothetical protein
MEIIIHKNEQNTLSTTTRADINFTMLEIGYLVVPQGIKFKIIDSDYFESKIDNDFLEAFDYDFENNYDGVGMSDNEWKSYNIEKLADIQKNKKS